MKRRVGAPGRFETPEIFFAACSTYFESLNPDKDSPDHKPRPPTTTGLALHLGISARHVYTIADRSDEFYQVIEWVRDMIATWHETRVAVIVDNSVGWLKKNRPEEWGEAPKDAASGLLAGGDITINIQKNYVGKEDLPEQETVNHLMSDKFNDEKGE